MSERQIDVKTAALLVSIGMTVAGGSGTVLGARINSSLESRVGQTAATVDEVQHKIADHEVRLRNIERDFLRASTEIKADLQYIKSMLEKQGKR